MKVKGLGSDWAAPLHTDGTTSRDTGRGCVAWPLKTWVVAYDGVNDVVFQVVATAVPEPSSIVALLCGLGTLAGLALRSGWRR